MRGVGLLCDYFAASSDADAAATIDRDGGPGATTGASAGYSTVSGDGIEPVVQLGTLEALLTGRTYDEVLQAHTGAAPVASRDGGERLIVRLSDGLTGALVAASDDRLADGSVPWSQTEEFWGQGDPQDLAGFLVELAQLARRAQSRRERLYCWLSA